MSRSLAATFRVAPGKRAQLAKRDPADASAFPDRKAAEEQSKNDGKAINVLQDRLFAEGKRALLVVLQGTDTSGKDGTIRHVFNATGPLGVSVTAFGQPSKEELAHDFLLRAHLACPRRGCIGIFNRSHYEDVLIGRVRELAPVEEIEARYGQINDFERMLSRERHHHPQVHAAHLPQGAGRAPAGPPRRAREPLEVQPRRPRGPQAVGRVPEGLRDHARQTSTAQAPWHVIPADRKWARNAGVAAIVRETLEAMDPQYPVAAWDPRDYKVD